MLLTLAVGLRLRLVGKLLLAVVQNVDAVHVDPIEAVCAVHLVLEAVLGRNQVIARSGVYVVFPGAALDVVVAASPVGLVFAVRTVEGVAPEAARQGVSAGLALYEVGTLTATYGVGVGRADEVVIAIGALAGAIADFAPPVLGQGHPCEHEQRQRHRYYQRHGPLHACLPLGPRRKNPLALPRLC